MHRPNLRAAAIPLLCLAPAALCADIRPAAPPAGPLPSVSAAPAPLIAIPPVRLAAPPRGTPPVAILSAPASPPSAIAPPAAPPTVLVRFQPGTALRYVTPAEVAARSARLSSTGLPGGPADLAPDEALLDCALPESPAPAVAPASRAAVPPASRALAMVPRAPAADVAAKPPRSAKGGPK